MLRLFQFLSKWPLLALHSLGFILGWLAFLASPTYRKRLWRHARSASASPWQALVSIGQTGAMMLEIPRMWMGKEVTVSWQGEQNILEAYARQKGVLFLTPHFGCFEVVAKSWASRFAENFGSFTVLFRPSRKKWMADIVANSRNRAGLEAVPTNSSGVRQLLKALKQGRAIGLLPDQVPPDGQGVWVPFFGQNAYTMTLAARLAQQTGATVLMGWGERLSWGRGYLIHIEKLPLMVTQGEGVLSDDLTVACAQMNQAMETLILQKPSQYLWGYGRYKQPRTSTE
jgi:KDO2-lipid IV(A) lauroyltransferase